MITTQWRAVKQKWAKSAKTAGVNRQLPRQPAATRSWEPAWVAKAAGEVPVHWRKAREKVATSL
jgi:hypothetical protein